MRNNPGLPNKDEFVRKLNTKLQARLGVQFSQTKKCGKQRGELQGSQAGEQTRQRGSQSLILRVPAIWHNYR